MGGRIACPTPKRRVNTFLQTGLDLSVHAGLGTANHKLGPCCGIHGLQHYSCSPRLPTPISESMRASEISKTTMTTKFPNFESYLKCMGVVPHASFDVGTWNTTRLGAWLGWYRFQVWLSISKTCDKPPAYEYLQSTHEPRNSAF